MKINIEISKKGKGYYARIVGENGDEGIELKAGKREELCRGMLPYIMDYLLNK